MVLCAGRGMAVGMGGKGLREGGSLRELEGRGGKG